MLNTLRSDLYRLRRAHDLLVPVAFTVLLALAISIAAAASRIAQGEAIDARAIGDSYLATTAALGMDARFLTTPCGIPLIALIGAEMKADGIRLQLVRPRSRRHSVISKFAIALAYSLIMPALFLACFALFPALFGLSYASAPSAGVVTTWAACASAVCFGYCSLVIAVGTLVRSETAAWILSLLTVAGGFGGFAVQGLLLVGSLLGGAAADVADAVARLLPTVIASTLGSNFDATTVGVGMVTTTILPLVAWSCLAFAVSHLRFARKRL